MRQKLIVITLALLLLCFYWWLWYQQPGQLRQGDVVTPHLAGPIQWTAGGRGSLAVRLYAKSADETHWRALGLDALPYHVNPVADVTFSGNEGSLGNLHVELSHRC